MPRKTLVRFSIATACIWLSSAAAAEIGNTNSDLDALLQFVSDVPTESSDVRERATIVQWTAEVAREIAGPNAVAACEANPSATMPRRPQWSRPLVLAWHCARAVNPQISVFEVMRRVVTRIDPGAGVYREIADPRGLGRPAYVEEGSPDALSYTGPASVGISLRRAPDGSVEIDTLHPGGPAALVGMRPRDRLLSIGAMDVQPLSFPEIVALLRGAVGSSVNLGWRRGGAVLNASVRREFISALPTRVEGRNGIAVVTLAAFDHDAVVDRRDIARAFINRPPRAVLLDFRADNGGLFDAVVAVADLFLERGEVFSTDDGRARRVRRNAGNPIVPTTLPLYVLVGRGTGSGGELTAAALADRGRARILGERTSGRSVMRTLLPIWSYGAVRIRSGRLFRPSGHPISDGVEPHIPIDGNGTEYENAADPILEQAIAIIAQETSANSGSTRSD